MSVNYPQGFKSAKVLSICATAAFLLLAVLYIVSTALGVGQLIKPSLTFKLPDGSSQSLWLTIQVILFLLKFFAYVTAVVFFLIWLARSHNNLYALKPSHLQYSSGWAVGSWFIPFVNLVRPFQVVREVWWESDPLIPAEQTFLTASLHRAPAYMGFWWAAWLISNITFNILANVFDPDKPSSVYASAYLFVISGIASFIAVGFVIYLVLDITKRQETRFKNLTAYQGYSPPGMPR